MARDQWLSDPAHPFGDAPAHVPAPAEQPARDKAKLLPPAPLFLQPPIPAADVPSPLLWRIGTTTQQLAWYGWEMVR